MITIDTGEIMSTKHCPKCNTLIEFAQCDYRICDNCGWMGSWTSVVEKPDPEPEICPTCHQRVPK